jgi:4-diphosphocytidyl-2-C-methyl-D-erythritol kinase
MTATAFAKINLTLEILGTRRNDGFHDILSVMHKIPVGDEVSLEITSNSTIDFSCSENVCANEDNLAYKAFVLYRDKAISKGHEKFGAKIRIEKVMPTGAGLAGGSADGAAVLDLLNKALGVMTDSEMHSLAEALGSDVPFCLEKHTSCLCSGRGEVMKDITPLHDVFCLVAKPNENLPTKGIYKSYDELHGDDYTKNASFLMENALFSGNMKEVSSLLVNDFEEICVKRLPEIEKLRKDMISFGAMNARMSGSGSSVFGLFDNEKDMKNCEKDFLNRGLFCRSFRY